jgi:hypothetical protein
VGKQWQVIILAAIGFGIVGGGYAAAVAGPAGGGPELVPLAASAGFLTGLLGWTTLGRARGRGVIGGATLGVGVGVLGHVLFWGLGAGWRVLWLRQPVQFMAPPQPRPVGFADLVAGALLAVPVGVASAVVGWPSVAASAVVGGMLGWWQGKPPEARREEPA